MIIEKIYSTGVSNMRGICHCWLPHETDMKYEPQSQYLEKIDLNL